MPSIANATLCMDWRGRAREREVKLQLLGVTRNPLPGLAWSSARTRGKVATFGGDAQPFAWIGMVERANARKSCNFWGSRRVPAQPFAGIGVVERTNVR